jgi:hypothetical protein
VRELAQAWDLEGNWQPVVRDTLKSFLDWRSDAWRRASLAGKLEICVLHPAGFA